jgi:hypothetical protein
MVRPNLVKHAAGYPEAAALGAVTKTGQTTYGMAAVGPGKNTAGSQQIIDAVDRVDSRPTWISVWGGANTLAQALQDVRATRNASDLASFVAKMRVYTISDQDDAGLWIRTEFPDLFYIVSPGTDYGSATWSGISGDRTYNNGPMYRFDLVDNPWLTMNVIQNHGALGALYPRVAFIMEGDTPSWFGLIDHGLGWAVSPSYGGWGGRYAFVKPAAEPRAIWTNNNGTTRDTFTYAPGQTATSDQATIWRYRDHYHHDFAARMDWCVADAFSKANHNPIPALNGDTDKGVLTLAVRGGSTVPLSADGTSDPDGNTVTLTWWIYPEAGTLPAGATLSTAAGARTDVRVPTVSNAGTLHVILQAEDDGNPHLFAYRRAVLQVTP